MAGPCFEAAGRLGGAGSGGRDAGRTATGVGLPLPILSSPLRDFGGALLLYSFG